MYKYFLIFLLLTSGGFIQAQIPDAVKAEMDTRTASGEFPSIVIGLYSDGETHYYASGFQDVEGQQKANTETLYEIGSISKTFTALLLAKKVKEGKIKLDDPIANVLPDSLKLSDKQGVPITFKQLSTHTSGLLRLPFGYSPPDPLNPYKGYYRNDLFLYLSRFGPENVGQKHAYSNLAVGLLGETLAILDDSSYKDMIQQEILQPLQLQHTYFEVPEDRESYFATGYQKGKPIPYWDFDVLAGAGALRADIKDLVAYGKSYLDAHELSGPQELTTQLHYEGENGVAMGLGWFKSGQEISHGGGTYGFRTHLVVDLANQRVAAIMTNTGDASADDLALHLINPEKNPLFTGESTEIEISTEALQTYVGTYLNEGFQLTFLVTEENGKLRIKLNQQKAHAVTYIGNDRFELAVVKAQLQFDPANQTLTLFQNGQEIVFKKE